MQADPVNYFENLQDTEPKPIVPPTEKSYLPTLRQTSSPLLLNLPDTTCSEVLQMDDLVSAGQPRSTL